MNIVQHKLFQPSFVVALSLIASIFFISRNLKKELFDSYQTTEVRMVAKGRVEITEGTIKLVKPPTIKLPIPIEHLAVLESPFRASKRVDLEKSIYDMYRKNELEIQPSEWRYSYGNIILNFININILIVGLGYLIVTGIFRLRIG